MKPNSTETPAGCLNLQPCLTLNEYAEQPDIYFTSRSTFVFLAGDHSLQTTANLVDVSDVVYQKREGEAAVSIFFQNQAAVRCERVTNFTITGLNFSVHSQSLSQDYSRLAFITSTGVVIANSSFLGNGDAQGNFSRAIYSSRSRIDIVDCRFEGNTGDNGGAIKAQGSLISIYRSVFKSNHAVSSGGAIYASGSLVVIQSGEFVQNSARIRGGAVTCENRCNLTMASNNSSISYFLNRADKGAAVYLSINSVVFLTGTGLIEFRENVGKSGSGIFLDGASALYSNVGHLLFSGNVAFRNGGAIYTDSGSVSLGKNINSNHHFSNNTANNGGAIYFKSTRSRLSQIKITGSSTFDGNRATGESKPAGGAVYVYFSNFTLTGTATFSDNDAFYGAGIYVFGTDTLIRGSITLIENTAEIGGGVFIVTSKVKIETRNVSFIGNVARNRGGGLRISNFDPNNGMTIRGNFINNSAEICGGAVYIEMGLNVMAFDSVTVRGNSGSSLCLSDANVIFRGDTQIHDNTGENGGGIFTRNSTLRFTDSSRFYSNSAVAGGAIYSLFGSRILFGGVHTFIQNIADREGGALSIQGTDIVTAFKNTLIFTSNSASNGGAIYLGSRATLTLDSFNILNATDNRADYGGVIYNEDTTIPSQCYFETSSDHEIVSLQFCSIQLKNVIAARTLIVSTHTQLISNNDFAGKDGSFLYGGLLDRCQMEISNTSDDLQNSFVPFKYLQEKIFKLSVQDSTTRNVTSQAYQLCFCESDEIYNCSESRRITVLRGQRFEFSLLALDQMRHFAPTVVTAKISGTAELDINQNSQVLPRQCSTLTYNLYSTENRGDLVLYPDGPCRDTGLNTANINITLLPCPDAFMQSGSKCVCEERLLKYSAVCVIDKTPYITRRAGSEFWMSALYNEDMQYGGLIVYRSCPTDYCKSNTSVNITLDNLDIQCDLNRGKMLCGACINGSSLMLGGFSCGVCSNTFLALLIPFVMAGIVLVFILTILRLTVATGMINSIILYANIVQVNRVIFFPYSTRNILTVFIAWLNLDLGFQSCFYDGMDAYAQTWLQLCFPLYIWILMGLIIVTSRYSILMSKLIGHNPIAVLATLLLMSYTKGLKIIIEVYSSVELDYPNNKKVTVAQRWQCAILTV